MGEYIGKPFGNFVVPLNWEDRKPVAEQFEFFYQYTQHGVFVFIGDIEMVSFAFQGTDREQCPYAEYGIKRLPYLAGIELFAE
jgi:hypothetical protein